MEESLMQRVERLEKALYDIVFAYANKDEDLPHDFEVKALKAAAELLPSKKFVANILADAMVKAG